MLGAGGADGAIGGCGVVITSAARIAACAAAGFRSSPVPGLVGIGIGSAGACC